MVMITNLLLSPTKELSHFLCFFILTRFKYFSYIIITTPVLFNAPVSTMFRVRFIKKKVAPH